MRSSLCNRYYTIIILWSCFHITPVLSSRVSVCVSRSYSIIALLFFSCHFSSSSHALHRSNCHWHYAVKIHSEFSFFFTVFFFLMWQTEIECIDDFCSIFQYCLRIQFGILERDWPLKRRWQWVIWFPFFRKCTTLLSSTFLLFVSLSFVVTIRITFHEVKTMNDDLFHLYIFSYLSTIEWRLFQWWTFTMCACLCWIEIVNDQYDMEIQSAHWECWSSWQTW